MAIVAATAAGTLFAIVALLNASLSTIAAKTDQLNLQQSNDLVQASVESLLDHLTAMTTDNAQWDDAVAHLYRRKLDTAWAYESWGSVSQDAKPYDGTFILDENLHVLWGDFRGDVISHTRDDVFGTGFEALISKHREALVDGKSVVAGLTFTRYGPAVVSIGLIRPSKAPAAYGAPIRRFLVMTRHLTPRIVGDMGRTFRIDNMHIAPASERTVPYLSLVDADGQGVAHLAWTPRLEGAVAARSAHDRIWQITCLVAGLVLLFVLVSGYSLQMLARSEQRAKGFALTDGLSGLPNRRALFERLNSSASRAGQKTVVFIDLDGFKEVNDLYGHNVGDQLIMIVAAALRQYLPSGAMLARMGGDEFATLIHGAAGAAAGQTFALSALGFLTAPVRVGDHTVQIGASIGIATGDLGARSSLELFRRADMAMYHSKATGKGRITHFDETLDAARLHRQAVEKGIREGLARTEFDVVYQPIIDARRQIITSVEALVRWPRRPEGPLQPDQFIHIAEASGLIHELGQYVLKKACRDLCGISDLRLSVNVSPAQFRDPGFERKVAAIISETDFPVERLELEVTEGYLVESPDRAAAAVSNLKALGLSIALDDFGTGYSSIGYLRRFNFDRIKIDKSLAGRVDRDPQAAALVAGTVSIANALSMSVTAEGVETEEHVKLLKLAGCHHLQGFYYSRPVSLAAILDLMTNQSPERAGTSPARSA